MTRQAQQGYSLVELLVVMVIIGLLAAFGIREMVRTGAVAMGRGASVIEIDGILRSGIVPAVPANR